MRLGWKRSWIIQVSRGQGHENIKNKNFLIDDGVVSEIFKLRVPTECSLRGAGYFSGRVESTPFGRVTYAALPRIQINLTMGADINFKNTQLNI
jgi:hypothetical protein